MSIDNLIVIDKISFFINGFNENRRRLIFFFAYHFLSQWLHFRNRDNRNFELDGQKNGCAISQSLFSHWLEYENVVADVKLISILDAIS